ncbi:MAG: HIRAN domain-containing protein [Mariprofundaceae bacterium]|nr:HIRAN domain-containing protein [Mariprofundaceae bacterium]
MTTAYGSLSPILLFGGVGMNRRGFLQVISQGILYLPLVPAAALSMPQRRVIVQQSPVAGFQYHQGEKNFHRLCLGTALHLKREADNKYDKNAVAVFYKDNKLGFVPRADNTAIAQMLERGEQLFTRIVKLEQSKSPWDRVRFEVVLDG